MLGAWPLLVIGLSTRVHALISILATFPSRRHKVSAIFNILFVLFDIYSLPCLALTFS